MDANINMGISRLSKKIKEFDFSDLYSGWKAKIWVNPPLWQFERLQSGMIKEIYEAIHNLVVSWNFLDEEGNPLENNIETIRKKMPTDLLLRIIEVVSKEITVPKVKS